MAQNPQRIDCRMALFRRQFNNQPSLSYHDRIRQHDKSGGWMTGESTDSRP